MASLTGPEIRKELEHIACTVEIGAELDDLAGVARHLRDLSRRIEQRGVGGIDPKELDRARNDGNTWRDLYYTVEAKLKQANHTLEHILSFDPVRHFLLAIPPGLTLTVRHDHEPDPPADSAECRTGD